MLDPYRTSGRPDLARPRATPGLRLRRALVLSQLVLLFLAIARMAVAASVRGWGLEPCIAAVLFVAIAATSYRSFRRRRLLQTTSCRKADANATAIPAPRPRR